ncbi:hypothetical protein GW17_00054612 [Ensete ventricosum]|nr:hypothetical protein GW17_00054612 [Ensete ventricosum]
MRNRRHYLLSVPIPSSIRGSPLRSNDKGDHLSPFVHNDPSSPSASSSPTGPRRLSHFSAEASFCTRSSSSCTITITSAPTSNDTFPTPSAVDDGFYTCLPVSSLVQPLFSLPRAPVRTIALVSRCYVERVQQVPSRCQMAANPHPVDCLSEKPQRRGPLPLPTEPLPSSTSARRPCRLCSAAAAAALHAAAPPFTAGLHHHCSSPFSLCLCRSRASAHHHRQPQQQLLPLHPPLLLLVTSAAAAQPLPHLPPQSLSTSARSFPVPLLQFYAAIAKGKIKGKREKKKKKTKGITCCHPLI